MQQNDENTINRISSIDVNENHYSAQKMQDSNMNSSSSSMMSSFSSSSRTKEEITRDFEALVKGRYPTDDASDCGASLASFADFGTQQRTDSFTPSKAQASSTTPATRGNYSHHNYSIPHSAVKFSGARSVIGTPSEKPLKPRRVSVSSSAASAIVQRMGDPKVDAMAKRSFTPIHIKPRISKKEVQATNEGYASVAKLSEWLASDPTSHKKLRHVRKGRNIIQKSRKFEQDLGDVIVEEAHITKGAVSDKKAWLKQAFNEREEGTPHKFRSALATPLRSSNHSISTSSRYAKSEIGGYRPDLAAALRKTNAEVRGSSSDSSCSDSRSEIVTNDPAACASVSDKKDWLKNAFKSSGSGTTKSNSIPSKARSEIVPSSSFKRDDAAARAKERFLQRSAKKLAKTKLEEVEDSPSAPSSQSTITTDQESVSESSRGASVDSCPAVQPELEADVFLRDSDSESRSGPPSVTSWGSSSVVELGPQVEEDRTPVDFRSARQALIERSKKNGNQVNVFNKVTRRKEKFEMLEKMNKRKSGPFGMMKTSWDKASNDNPDVPSDAYTKHYVADIAPKKTFEELP